MCQLSFTLFSTSLAIRLGFPARTRNTIFSIFYHHCHFKLNFFSFANFILSKEDKKLNQLCTLRESYFLEPGEPLPFEVEWALARVSDQVIKNFRNIESLREILTNSFDFTMLDCFNAVDVDKLGVIDF
jgi:hypothetical protein